MKILFVGTFIEPPFAEGITNSILNWAKALKEEKIETQILSLSTKYSGSKFFSDLSFNYVKTESPRFHRNIFDSLRLQKAVSSFSKDFDVIHYGSHFDLSNSFFQASLLRLSLLTLNKKKILTYNSDRLGKVPFESDDLLFNRLIVPSQRLFLSFSNKFPIDKLSLVRPCVDTNIFRPRDKAAVREKLGIPQNDLVIFALGHFKHGRRLLELVQIIEELKEKIENIRLLIGWTGYGDFSEIEKHFKIFQKKKFVKVIPPTNMINLYYNATDIYVLTAKPSKVMKVPVSILEALSSGVPTISFQINGVPEIIKNGVNGFLIDEGNFHEMKTVLSSLLGDTHLLGKISKNARDSILNRFSYKIAAQQLSLIYHNLLEE